MKFGCTKCGLCCKLIGKLIKIADKKNTSPERLKMLQSFPHDLKDDGSCSKLVDNKCSVYDHRPDICNIEKMHLLTNPTMPQKEYFNNAAIVCNQLMDQDQSKAERVKLV